MFRSIRGKARPTSGLLPVDFRGAMSTSSEELGHQRLHHRGVAEPQNPFVPTFSQFNHLKRILWPGDDAGDAGDRLEGELGHHRLHHCACRASKPLRTNFQPMQPS